MAWQIPTDYYSILANIESGNNPNAKNSRSSASGLFQFTKKTWEKLGFDWGDRFNVIKQHEAVGNLTEQNASILDGAGIAITKGSLYAAHFLGVGTAKKALTARDDATLLSVVGQDVIDANPTLSGFSIGQFKGWLGGKVNEEGVGANSGSNSFFNNEFLFGPGGLSAWEVKDPILSAAFGARVVSVIIGIALIIIALVVLASNNETVQGVVKTALPIPKI